MSRHPHDPVTDAELDAYIRTRLAIVGVELSVLPEDDPAAPADRIRIYRSARNFLRNTVPRISGYSLDPQDVPPILYPAALPPPEDAVDSIRGRPPEGR